MEKVGENLEKLIENYQPKKEVLDFVRARKIVLLTGISGAGKDAVKREVLQASPLFFEIISHTTRPARKNNGQMEKNGKDYHFISKEKAEEMLKNKDFIEAKIVHGNIYGTSFAALNNYKNAKIAITDIDTQGASEYHKISKDIKIVFILPPSFETWLVRTKKRYENAPNFDKIFKIRKENAIKELEFALKNKNFQFVINDDLARAKKDVFEITSETGNYDDKPARKLGEKFLEKLKENYYQN